MELDLRNTPVIRYVDCLCGLPMAVPIGGWTRAELEAIEREGVEPGAVFVLPVTELDDVVLEGAPPVYFATCPECGRRGPVPSAPPGPGPRPEWDPRVTENTPLAPPLADEETDEG